MCTCKSRYRIGLLLLIDSGYDLCKIHRHLRICGELREALKRVPYTELDSEFSFSRIYEEFQAGEDIENLAVAEAFLKSEYGFRTGIKSLRAAMLNLEDRLQQAMEHVEFQKESFREVLEAEFGKDFGASLFPFSATAEFNFRRMMDLLTDPAQDDLDHHEMEARRNYYKKRIGGAALDMEPPNLLELETEFCVWFEKDIYTRV